MGFLSWIALGLIAGALAKLIMPGKDPGGIIVTILLGVAGAFVGGVIASLVGIGGPTRFSIGGIILATIGAIILLVLYRMLQRRRPAR